MRKPIHSLQAIAKDGQVILSWYKSGTDAQGQSFPDEETSIFSIYRREEPYTTDLGGADFFLGIDGADADLIFEGPLMPVIGTKFAYVDAGVQIGKTYTYFVQTKTSGRIGPIPIKVRDPRVWWPYAYLQERLSQLAKAFPGIARTYSCGETTACREIPCLEVGHGDKIMGLVGLVHAGESGPELIVPALEKLLHRAPQLFDITRVIAIPSLNIDMRERQVSGTPWYIRKNLQGTDLNRNFPAGWEVVSYTYGADTSDPDSSTYRGPYPASAPETKAVMSVFSQYRPQVVFSYHCLSSLTGLPALATARGVEDQEFVARCKRIVELYGEGLFPDNDGLKPEGADRERWLHFSPGPGTLPCWFYELGRIPAFDLEGGLMQAHQTAWMDLTDIRVLEEFQERHAQALENVIRGYLS